MADNSLNSPGVFRGQARLATQQDIINLKEYLERIIAGPLNEIDENGYIPWKYNADGTLDIDYLFPELVNKFSENQGVSVSSNGVKFADNVTSFNIQGKFVSLSIDENGCITWTIDEPQTTIPNFNEANMFGTALVKVDNEIVENMIIPDASSIGGNSPYGDWEAGQKVNGINWNGSTTYDALKLSTYGRVYASTLTSYFEVQVTDGMGGVFASFISSPIKSSTTSYLEPASTQNSQHIRIYIDNFKEESRGYSFAPRFELNLAKIVGLDGGRFNVKIVHHNGQSFSYISNDMLYNCGARPTVSTISVQILSDASSPSSEQLLTKDCSGVRYAKTGTAIVRLSKIYNLNNMAAVDDPIEYSFGIADAEDHEIIAENYDLSYDKVATFKVRFKLKDESLNNEQAFGKVKVKNAFGSSNEYDVSIPILLDSQTNLQTSDRLHEYFSDESFRVLSNFELDNLAAGEYSDLVEWDSSQSLVDYDSGRGLMVVPGKGVAYPFGNWDEFMPAGSPDYSNVSFLTNEKYFARVFTGNSSIKFGGVFVFDGLTKEQFMDQRLSIIISCSRGARWFNLKEIRNMESAVLRDDGSAIAATGILTDIEEKDGKLYVSWSYPTGVSSRQPLYFKLGMKPTSPFMIKSISLLNSDEEEDW